MEKFVEKIELSFYVGVLCCLLVSCASTRGIGENQQRVSYDLGRIAEAIETIDRTIDSSTSRIEDCVRRSREFEDGIQRLVYLFECYEQESNRLLNSYNSVRDTLEDIVKSADSNNSYVLPDKNYTDYFEALRD